MKLNANNNGQKESLNHNTLTRTKENSMKNSGVTRTYELLHDVELLSVGEEVLEYVASVKFCDVCNRPLTFMGDCLAGCFHNDEEVR